MAIQLNLMDPQVNVETAEPQPGLKVKVLMFRDPESGIIVQIMMDENSAYNVANALSGGRIQVARPGSIPQSQARPIPDMPQA